MFSNPVSEENSHKDMHTSSETHSNDRTHYNLSGIGDDTDGTPPTSPVPPHMQESKDLLSMVRLCHRLRPNVSLILAS